MKPPPVLVLRDHIVPLLAGHTGPLTVAIDGRSGAGKSMLASALTGAVVNNGFGISVIEGDDFYGGGDGSYWDGLSAEAKVDHVIDWRRQRSVLQRLRSGQPASWHPFDWDAFDGRLSETALTSKPTDVVVLEGAYSARPELADLLDLRVLLDTPMELRKRRLIEREGEDYVDAWSARWTEAEDRYFGSIMPPDRFDLVLVDG